MDAELPQVAEGKAVNEVSTAIAQHLDRTGRFKFGSQHPRFPGQVATIQQLADLIREAVPPTGYHDVEEFYRDEPSPDANP